MDRNTALTRLLDVDRRISAMHAERAELLVQVASEAPVVQELLVLDPRPGHDEERRIRIEDAAREEVAAALRWSPVTAHARIDEARMLAGPLRASAEALRCGDISPGHVTAIAEAARRLPGRFATDPDHQKAFSRRCRLLEKRVLPIARRSTIAATKRAANRWVGRIDPGGLQRRLDEQLCTRGVRVIDEFDGMSTMIARLATVDAHAVMAAVQHRADAQPISGTAGEMRADALRDLVLTDAQVHVHLDVVVSAESLVDGQEAPAEIAGATVSMEEVRGLLLDPAVSTSMRRLVCDPVTGHLLDRAPRRYVIPADLRAFIVARDQHCRFPGCRRRASTCQVDHATAFEDGGETTVANLGALCVRHHQLKTHGGWVIAESRADGSCTWVSPMGRRYDEAARPILHDGDPPPF